MTLLFLVLTHFGWKQEWALFHSHSRTFLSIASVLLGAASGVIAGVIMHGRSLLAVYQLLVSAFHPAVIALMVGVLVGRDMLLVAEYVHHNEERSTTSIVHIARTMGILTSTLCRMYMVWAGLCVLALSCCGGFFFVIVYLPVTLCAVVAFMFITWSVKEMLARAQHFAWISSLGILRWFFARHVCLGLLACDYELGLGF